MKKFNFKRMLCMLMAVCVMASLAVPTFAATDNLNNNGNNGSSYTQPNNNGQRTDSATIDPSQSCSVELYKIDWTNAAKDGVWNGSSYVSTGVADTYVENTLINSAVRAGDTDGTSVQGNGNTSNGYAIKGVEFTYVKVGTLVTYTENEDGAEKVMLLYRLENTKAAGFLSAIGLSVDNRYKPADGIENLSSSDVSYFQSDVLVNALASALATNATNVKNALELYASQDQTSITMKETDANGYTYASGLSQGLYLFVETKVPEMVTCTTNPFLLSLPMTSVDGTNTTTVTDGGEIWLYDVTLYPKNETGIVSLEKTVRESIGTSGENNGSELITDGYKHYVAVSSGDVLEFQIISTLPSITSTATQISDYTFTDILNKGMTFTKGDVIIEWYRDEACTDLITTWTEGSGKFSVAYVPNQTNDGTDTTMTIAMTTAGLTEINTATSVWSGANQVRRGYSDCTMRITYTATFDGNATATYGDTGNCNDVSLVWKRSNSAYYDMLIDDAHVYSYAMDLTKLFSDGAGNFDEVEFVLWNNSDGYWVTAAYNASENVYYVTNKGSESHVDGTAHAGLDAEETADAAAANGTATIFKPVDNNKDTQGELIIRGLEPDEYILTEVRTSNGYTLLKDHITINITVVETEAICHVYTEDELGVIQNDPRYASVVKADMVDTTLGLGASSNGVDGTNIPQTHLEHHLLTASATVDGNAVTMLSYNNSGVASNNASVPLTIVNTHGFNLPQTGEIGAVMLPLVGVVGMVAIVAVLFVLKKKEDEETAAI